MTYARLELDIREIGLIQSLEREQINIYVLFLQSNGSSDCFRFARRELF